MRDPRSTATSRPEVPDRLLDAAGISIDRLPLLRIVFDRLGTQCTDNIRHMTASPLYFLLSDIISARTGDVLDGYEGSAIVAIFHAPGWDSHILIGIDRAFMYSAVEALFGADGSEPPGSDERAFSNIETRVAGYMFEQIAKALRSSFAGVADTPLNFERIETRMDLAVIGRRNNLSLIAKFDIQTLERGGEMFVMIPQSALHPMRQNLARAASSDPSVRDPRWSKQIQREVKRAEVTLKAVLEQREMTLGEIAELKVGQVLRLQATPDSRVKVECNNQTLFWCELGKANGGYQLRVQDFVDEEQEFIDDILPR